MLRLLPAMLKPELYRRIVELVGVDDYWDPILKAGLSQEAYLDVVEAIVEIEYVPKNVRRDAARPGPRLTFALAGKSGCAYLRFTDSEL